MDYENKEAIKTLKLIREDFEGEGNELADGRKALDRAIKALEFIDENFPKTFIDYLNYDLD